MEGTLEDFFEDAHALELEAFTEKYGSLFFTCADSETLNPQAGPQVTTRLSRDLMRAVIEGAPSPQTLVLPIRRKPESAFRFISVGRTANCDIAINDESISKLHAIIREDDGRFTIEDANSANGTWVDTDAAPVRSARPPLPLRGGVEVRFGAVAFELWTAATLQRSARLLPRSAADRE